MPKRALALNLLRNDCAAVFFSALCLAVLSFPQLFLAALRELATLVASTAAQQKAALAAFFSRTSCTCGSCARQRFAVTCENFAVAVFCSDAAIAFTRVSTRGEANSNAVCFALK